MVDKRLEDFPQFLRDFSTVAVPIAWGGTHTVYTPLNERLKRQQETGGVVRGNIPSEHLPRTPL